jgi:hypothetical protein
MSRTSTLSKNDVDLSQDRLFSLGWGLIYRVVCAPKSWSADRVSETATRNDPPGTSLNRWEVSEPREREDPFNNYNNVQCPDDPDRVHWLINC